MRPRHLLLILKSKTTDNKTHNITTHKSVIKHQLLLGNTHTHIHIDFRQAESALAILTTDPWITTDCMQVILTLMTKGRINNDANSLQQIYFYAKIKSSLGGLIST